MQAIVRLTGLEELTFPEPYHSSFPYLDRAKVGSLASLRGLTFLELPDCDAGELATVLHSCTLLRELRLATLLPEHASALRSKSVKILHVRSVCITQITRPFRLAESNVLPCLERVCIHRLRLSSLKDPQAAYNAARDVDDSMRYYSPDIAAMVELGNNGCLALDTEDIFDDVMEVRGAVPFSLVLTALCSLCGNPAAHGVRTLKLGQLQLLPGDMGNLSALFPRVEAIRLHSSVVLPVPAGLHEAVHAFPVLSELHIFVGGDEWAVPAVVALCTVLKQEPARRQALTVVVGALTSQSVMNGLRAGWGAASAWLGGTNQVYLKGYSGAESW